MFKPELWQSHDEYRTIVNTYGRRLSRNNPEYSFDLYDKERQKLLNFNLDTLLDYIPQFYSDGGRPAKNQAQILRSLILFTLLFNKTPAKTSLTLWVTDVLPNSISLTVLVGCTCAEDLPPLGSYYDLMNRFWLAPRDIYSRHCLLPEGRNGKNLLRRWALTANWRITIPLPPAGISYQTSQADALLLTIPKLPCRRSLPCLPCFLLSASD